MQNVIRKTALARNQAKRKAILADKAKKRDDLRQSLRQRFAYDRMELDRIRDERQRRWEDWMRGPLAPQRDSGSDKKSFGALNPQAMNPPVIPKHLRRKFVNFAEGDRVCIMKGRDQGRINEVTKVDAENETVTVKDLNMAEVAFPDWLNEQYGNNTPFLSMPMPVSMNDVQLVVALDDPTKGKTRDVLAEHVYGAGPILEQPYGSNTPKHTRYISGLDIEIPWPRSTAQPLKDEASDTVRLDVEMPTWIPSLDHAPFPPSVIDELRNKYSKYRTRHESEYVKEKKMEEYRKEYLQSQTMLTPRGQLRALKLAEKAEALNSRKDADGNMIMEPGTAEFIEKFMQKRKGNKAKSAA